MMSVYMVFSFDVSDRERFAPYGRAVTPVLERHGAEVLVADFGVKSLEGEAQQGNVVIRFPSEEQAKAFYNDPDYIPLKKLRAETTREITVYLAKEFVHPS